MIEVLHYLDRSGRDLVRKWLDDLNDVRAKVRIAMRIDRLGEGNFGDCKPLDEGIWNCESITGQVIAFITHGREKKWCCSCVVVTKENRRRISNEPLDIGKTTNYGRINNEKQSERFT